MIHFRYIQLKFLRPSHELGYAVYDLTQMNVVIDTATEIYKIFFIGT